MDSKPGIVAISLASLLAALFCIAPAAAAEKPLLDYRQITLDNGLRVITLEDFAAPVVTVEVWYHVGSKNEDPNRRGFAHMFEHMMFRGTDRLGPTEHFDYLRRVGGWCNGSTGFDRTMYIETLPAGQLELALWLEAERMGMLKIDQTAFDTERKVVEEERRMGLNQPYGSLIEKGMAELFHVHPYRWTPIGRIPDLRASSVQELRDFWKRYYAPSNATLVISGAVSNERAQELARRYFGWIGRYDAPPPVRLREPAPDGPRAITINEKNAPAPLAGLVWRTVDAVHPDATALDMLGIILGGGDSSRLYRSMVAQGQLAVAVEAEQYSLEQDGLFLAGAAMSPLGADIAKATAELNAQVERLRNEKVTDRELTKARNRMLRNVVSSMNTTAGRASMLGSAAVLEGDASRANTAMDRVRAVTADDILRVARVYLDPNRQLTVTVPRNLPSPFSKATTQPGEDDAPVTAPAETAATPPGRQGTTRPADMPDKPPLAKIAPTVQPPQFTRQTLPNGLKVIVVPNHNAPEVTIQLGLLAGGWTEAKRGTCSMALSLLTKGTGERTEEQLADEMDTYAISIYGSGNMDASTVNASCLSEHLQRTMDLLADVVLHPTFPAGQFSQQRTKVRSRLAIEQASPPYLADRQFAKSLFGTHPYAEPETGTTANVDALKVDDIRQWWSTFARPDMAVLMMSGDVTPEQGLELARKAFGGWQAQGPRPQVKLPAPPPAEATRIFLVDKPDAVQSQIRVGQISFTRKDGRYFISRVMDGYFGRGFGSRLNKTIRVEKGLTYGIGGGTVPYRFEGVFGISTFTKTESTAPTVEAIMEQIAGLKGEPPTADELNDIKSYILGSYPCLHETPQQMAGELWLIEQEKLGDDWVQRMLAAVAGVTADECVKLANDRIDPAKLVIVVVGQAAKVKDALEKIAPVTVIEAQPATATSMPATAAASATTEKN